ncbi:glycogen synthase [Ruminiclostridium josui]|uniref:glycogen synthase n=1 Tax=Ruminiclostridium josui TaxID=1499 RepID=UPI00046376DF|nr:glycogen/starch synthase [Ruminiclostridium josui]
MNLSNKQLKVLFVSAEVDPFAKTGGLADVAGSLPKELTLLGQDVRVFMPRYKSIDTELAYVTDFPVDMGDRKETCVIKEGSIHVPESKEVKVYFLENYHYYYRDGIYCYQDDAQRFIMLCKAALEMLPYIDFKPDIIHCNDWHTGPLCLLLKEKYAKQDFYKDIATVYTIHNLEYQGNFSADTCAFMNVEENFFTYEKAEFYGMFSFMKCGLVYSDKINTVSKQYAKEILTTAYGEKMEGILINRKKDLYGIVNGISYEEFDPGKNEDVYTAFDSKCPWNKKENKRKFQKEFGLAKSDAPLLAIVTRLTHQKGLELILGCIDKFINENDIQLAVLGIGDEYYHNSFKELEKKYPDNVAVFLEFNHKLAKKIYASADMFLMPSRFEPCGLGQIISFRYGTIPVVRATGGLAETVIDYDVDRKNGNGFSFTEFNEKEFENTLDRAIQIYCKNSKEWENLVIRALKSDFSWKKPCTKYLDLYKIAIEDKNR